MPFSFMEHYGTAVGLTLIYLLFLFGVMGAALWLERKRGETGSVCEGAHSSASREREICWLSIFLSAFAVPFFLHRDYFGTSDELVLTFVLAALLLVLGKKREGGTEGSKQRGGIGKDFSGDNDSDRRNFYSDCHSIGIFRTGCPGSAVRQAVCGHVAAVVPLRILGTAIFLAGCFAGLGEENGGRTFCARWEAYARRSSGQRREITAARFFYGFVGVILPALCLTALGMRFLSPMCGG